MTLMINVSCKGSERSKRLELQDGDELNIGRSFDEASLIVDALLSRKHFNIRYEDGKIKITHLSKTNPTIVASDGTSDFEKIRGEKIEHNGCRIIAGSHRFVLKVVKPDSVHDDSFSDDFHTEESAQEESSRFWSDVDSSAADPSPPEHLFSDDANAGTPSTSRETLPSHDVKDDTPDEARKRTETTRDQGLFDDDFNDSGQVERRTESMPVKQSKVPKKESPPPAPVKKDPPKQDTKKPFFPVTDDFFDD